MATSTTRAGNSTRFVTIEFLSQITNTRQWRIQDFRLGGGGGQDKFIHLIKKNIYTKFSKYFYKNNAEIKTQYNCSVILKFQNGTVQISHKSYAGSSLRGFISNIRLGFLLSNISIILPIYKWC